MKKEIAYRNIQVKPDSGIPVSNYQPPKGAIPWLFEVSKNLKIIYALQELNRPLNKKEEEDLDNAISNIFKARKL